MLKARRVGRHITLKDAKRKLKICGTIIKMGNFNGRALSLASLRYHKTNMWTTTRTT